MAKEGEGKKTTKDDRYERVIKSYGGRDRLSLNCYTSPPPNLWGARSISPAPPRVRSRRRKTFQIRTDW